MGNQPPNAFSAVFLRAKHWHIFLTFASLMLFDIAISTNSVLSNANTDAALGKFELLNGLLTLVPLVIFDAWFWSMGSFLNSLAPPRLKLSSKPFAVSLVYPPLYIAFFFLLFQDPNPKIVLWILPFHFFAMFCLFYNLYFVAKVLVLAETRRPASFYDYAGPFFLIWFFPVGVWFTQPRINRLYAQARAAQSEPIA